MYLMVAIYIYTIYICIYIYIDRLLCKLRKSGFGCHINHVYIMGALPFADDITISCPSIHALNLMLDISM